MRKQRQLLLEDGRSFQGVSFGDEGEAVCELVFNTSMVGYQEILSDPSYTDQAVVMTYPLIGNYGICADDFETAHPSIGAFIVRECEGEPSNFRAMATLEETMRHHHIPGLAGVDTREVTRIIRSEGHKKVLLCDANIDQAKALERLRASVLLHDAVSRVSRKEITEYPARGEERYRVVAIDCGMKQTIVTSLCERGCRVIAVPYDTNDAAIADLRPDGVFISNGPGDPTDVPVLIETVRCLRGRYAMFGICLGHQVMALAYGAKTYKLKFGHRGGNHPVKNLQTGKIEITSQNHSYAVDAESLDATPLSVTHINLLDGTIEGLACRAEAAFSVQYHPESAPGPEDSRYLFDQFMEAMKERKNHAEA